MPSWSANRRMKTIFFAWTFAAFRKPLRDDGQESGEIPILADRRFSWRRVHGRRFAARDSAGAGAAHVTELCRVDGRWAARMEVWSHFHADMANHGRCRAAVLCRWAVGP